MDFFQKLGLALGLGLGLGLAIQIVKMDTSDGPDGVKGWESIEKRIFEQSFWPKVLKSGLFSKARVSVRVRVRARGQSYETLDKALKPWTKTLKPWTKL